MNIFQNLPLIADAHTNFVLSIYLAMAILVLFVAYSLIGEVDEDEMILLVIKCIGLSTFLLIGILQTAPDHVKSTLYVILTIAGLLCIALIVLFAWLGALAKAFKN
jgi:hypothetical protein